MNDKHLTAHQRAVLIHQALTQGDIEEADRLMASAPVRPFTGPNPAILLVLARLQAKRHLLLTGAAAYVTGFGAGERVDLAAELAAVDAAAMADPDLSATWEPTVELLKATQADALRRMMDEVPDEVPDEVRALLAKSLETRTPPEPNPERVAYWAAKLAPHPEPAPAQMDA
jgi:hypothetical protein